MLRAWVHGERRIQRNILLTRKELFGQSCFTTRHIAWSCEEPLDARIIRWVPSNHIKVKCLRTMHTVSYIESEYLPILFRRILDCHTRLSATWAIKHHEIVSKSTRSERLSTIFSKQHTARTEQNLTSTSTWSIHLSTLQPVTWQTPIQMNLKSHIPTFLQTTDDVSPSRNPSQKSKSHSNNNNKNSISTSGNGDSLVSSRRRISPKSWHPAIGFYVVWF